MTTKNGLASGVKMQLFGSGNFQQCPNGATASSPGLPLRLPWELVRKEISTATRLRRFLRNAQSRCNRVAVEGKIAFFTQGSRSGNPGLAAVAPLGHHSELS